MLVGIDTNIADIIDTFNTLLWTTSNRAFYGQVYRNTKDGNIIPEIYESDGKNYKEVIFDDRKDALCFFDLGNEISNLSLDNQPTRDCRIVFCVNLEKLYPLIAYRAEENAHYDALAVIRKWNMDVQVNSILIGQDAFGDLFTDNVKRFNMQPYHTFALNCTIKINYSNC